MADVNIGVAVGADISAFEAQMAKAKALGKKWATDVSSDGSRAAATVGASWENNMGKASKATMRFSAVLRVLPAEVQSVVGAITSVFTSGAGLVITAVATAIALVSTLWTAAREKAEAESQKMYAAVEKTFKRAQALATVNSTDPVKRGISKLALGDESGAAAESAALRAEAAGLRAQGGGKGAREREITAQEYINQAKQIEDAIGKERDRQMALQVERDADAWEKRQRAVQESRRRSEEDATRAKALTDARRGLSIAQAPTDEMANRLRIRYAGEDYRTARAGRNAALQSGDTGRAAEYEARMLAMQTEALTIWKQIKENTKSGSKL